MPFFPLASDEEKNRLKFTDKTTFYPAKTYKIVGERSDTKPKVRPSLTASGGTQPSGATGHNRKSYLRNTTRILKLHK